MIEKTTPAKRALQSVEEVRSQVGRLRRSVKAMESRCVLQSPIGTAAEGKLWPVPMP